MIPPKPIKMSNPLIYFDAISKQFPSNSNFALQPTTLMIERGEFFVLLGPSGCGKTTLMRILAGFETPTAGRVFINGNDVSSTLPNQRPINMVFQSYALFPNMTVAKNIGYGLRLRKMAKAAIEEKVQQALTLVAMDDFGQLRPHQLSGGQRQRIALARALVMEPQAILLDEPLSALDAKLRKSMQNELCRLQQQLGMTFLMVTHDQDEALSMADRIAVLDNGSVRQVGTPTEIYNKPSNLFVADFIGSCNFFAANVSNKVAHIDGLPQFTSDCGYPDNTRVQICIRPENVVLLEEPNTATDAFTANITEICYTGKRYQIVAAIKDTKHRIQLESNSHNSYAIGDTIHLRIPQPHCFVLPQ